MNVYHSNRPLTPKKTACIFIQTTQPFLINLIKYLMSFQETKCWSKFGLMYRLMYNVTYVNTHPSKGNVHKGCPILLQFWEIPTYVLYMCYLCTMSNFPWHTYLLEMSSSWNFPARVSPSCEGSEPRRAEQGHFNFRAETELTIPTICMSIRSKS